FLAWLITRHTFYSRAFRPIQRHWLLASRTNDGTYIRGARNARNVRKIREIVSQGPRTVGFGPLVPTLPQGSGRGDCRIQVRKSSAGPTILHLWTSGRSVRKAFGKWDK